MERWKINLYILWFTQVLSLMGFGLAIPFLPYYMQELGVTSAVQLNYYTGLASTIPALAMAVAAPIWGIVGDKKGRKLMLMRAMFCSIFIIGGMGFINAIWQLMILRALQGIFSGTITASMAFVSANTPENRMSFALGFMTSSNFIGYSLGPLIGGVIAETIGFRPCFIIGGLLMAIGFLLVVVFVKEDPETFGVRLEKQKGGEDDTKLLNATIVVILIGLFLSKIARTAFTPFVPLFVQESLGTMVGAATYTGIINGATGLATAIAALTIARLGDKYSKIKIVIILTLIALPVSIVLFAFDNLWMFIIFYSIYFLAGGGTEPLMTSAASEAAPAKKRGALFGILGTVNSLSMMTAPMIGAFLSTSFGIKYILLLIPIFTMIQLVSLAIPYRRAKRKNQEASNESEL